MKKFAVLLTTAILGSAAFAAGTNMIQDEPGPDSRPARVNEKSTTAPVDLDPAPVDDFEKKGPPKRTRDLNAVGREVRRTDDAFDDGGPRGQNSQNHDPLDDSAYGGEGPGMGFGYGGALGGRQKGMDGRPDLGPGMGADGGMSGPEGRYMRPRSVTRTIVEQRMEPISKEEIAEMKKLAEAIRLLHESKDEEARKKAADTIREQLNAQFDRDLKRREKELADIEARLKTLREQVEKRKAARDRIVGLRLDTIVNEADGLGFPADSVGSANNFPSRNRSAAGGDWLDIPTGQTLPGGYRVPGLGTTVPKLKRGDDFLPPGDPAVDILEPAEVPEEVSDELPADLQPR
jgi:hypothetical protein